MILAGEIGATRTRLAAFETEGNRLQCVVEKTYMSQQHDGLSGILADFTKNRRHSRSQRMPRRGRAGASGTKQDFQPALGHRCAGSGQATQTEFGWTAQRSGSLRLWNRWTGIKRLHHVERRRGRG